MTCTHCGNPTIMQYDREYCLICSRSVWYFPIVDLTLKKKAKNAQIDIASAR